ncbi:putative tetratricopeptide-like helical domain superfamily [Plasmopara halstedii]
MESVVGVTILMQTERLTNIYGRTAGASTVDVAALDQELKELQCVVDNFSKNRVLELSGMQLMNAGVELYNAPRAALRALPQGEIDEKQGDGRVTAFPRYSLVLTRYVAAKVMELSLTCSNDKENLENSGKNLASFIDECIDVLRSFGRVGMLMLESASLDCDKCEIYLSLAKDSFFSAMQLWSRIGLFHLTKFKQGLELEDIIDDLWDFWVDRVRVHQLHAQHSTNLSEEARDILSSLHELKMLAPYKTSYASSLLDLMKSVSDDYRQVAYLELQVPFVEEVLRIGDTLENDGDGDFLKRVISFQQHVLLNLLQALCTSGDFEQAERCYHLFPNNKDPKVLLLMNKLYVDKGHFDRAHRLLQLMFQQNCFEDSIAGARVFAQGYNFSDKGLDIYRELADNYKDADFVINLDVACSLAFVEGKRHESMEELKRIGCILLEKQRGGQVIDSKHIHQIRQTFFDALQEALNSNKHEECLRWADAALAISSIQDAAMYMRISSRSCIQLGRNSEALDWAEKAFDTEPSKQSLLAVFQAKIEVRPEASYETLAHIVEQIKARDDFFISDLLALGKIANSSTQSREDIVMLILDTLCHLLLDSDIHPASLSIGVVLQKAAQLAFTKRKTQQQVESIPLDNSKDSYSKTFLTYTDALLLKSANFGLLEHKKSFGPSSVFEWFFRMSFDIAKSTENSRYFILAANIAERSDELYNEESPLRHRCQPCLLAAVSSDVKKIEILNKSQLSDLLGVINRIESIQDWDATVAAELKCYLTRVTIAVKLRLFDTDTTAIFNLCKAIQQSGPELEEIGELVMYATRFDEANNIRESYRSLAGQIFSYGLQVLIHEGSTDSSKLCYLLRRLIMLAESKLNAFEWFEQVLQLVDNLDVKPSEHEMEWFAVKAWNIGVLCQRSNNTKEALRFMTVAQSILRRSDTLVEKLGDEMSRQYQALLGVSTNSVPSA